MTLSVTKILTSFVAILLCICGPSDGYSTSLLQRCRLRIRAHTWLPKSPAGSRGSLNRYFPLTADGPTTVILPHSATWMARPESQDGDRVEYIPAKLSGSVRGLNVLFSRSAWVAWWCQIVLSVIAAVILTFANTVRTQVTTNRNFYLWASGFSFSAIGVACSLGGALWTWNVTRLTRRVKRKKVEDKNVIPTLRRYAQIAVGIALVGMFFTVIGAEQIVGTLTSKILSSQGVVPLLASPGMVGSGPGAVFQPVDIFLVQANTNAMLSQFCNLVCYLLLQTQFPKSKKDFMPLTVQYKPDVGGAGDASGDGASGADPHASAV